MIMITLVDASRIGSGMYRGEYMQITLIFDEVEPRGPGHDDIEEFTPRKIGNLMRVIKGACDLAGQPVLFDFPDLDPDDLVDVVDFIDETRGSDPAITEESLNRSDLLASSGPKA